MTDQAMSVNDDDGNANKDGINDDSEESTQEEPLFTSDEMAAKLKRLAGIVAMHIASRSRNSR